MAKTEFVKRLDDVLVEVRKYLKQEGFRKQNHTFNRKVGEGLFHVINFQMGRYSFDNAPDIPGLRESKYGQFTVNLGVCVSEIYELTFKRKLPFFPKEWDCDIRERLGVFAYGQDAWWDLTEDTDHLIQEMLRQLKQYGVPFLNRFLTRDDIIYESEQHNYKIGFICRGKISIAIILAKQGKLAEAKELLQTELSEEQQALKINYIKNISRKLNIPID